MANDYAPDKIRNVVLLGHSHDGKTMLTEAMLFASGAVPRMGSPDSSTATTDFEPEEQKRKISINLGVAFAEHNGFKINILDAPGFFDFAGQVVSGLRAAEGAVVVVGPTSQLAVGTEIAWSTATGPASRESSSSTSSTRRIRTSTAPWRRCARRSHLVHFRFTFRSAPSRTFAASSTCCT